MSDNTENREPYLSIAREANGNEHEEPWTSLDEMHATPPFAPAGADPFSPAAAHDPEASEDADEMTIGRDAVVRRNGIVEDAAEESDAD